MSEVTPDSLIAYTVDIVAAHISSSNVSADQLPRLIADVYKALAALDAPAEAAAPAPEPAVPVRLSIKPDYIVCLEDGKKLKMLRRHLMTHFQMSPDQYRAKWSLPADYPMVAPNYAEQRRSLAKQIGLGTRRGAR